MGFGRSPRATLAVRSPRIAIDTLGADAGPSALVAGALDAISAAPAPSARLIFFGDARTLAAQLPDSPHDIVDAPRPVSSADPLRASLRGTRPSSMRAAIAALAGGDVDAVVSAGSTGALLALSRHLVGMAPGVRWPAIIKAFGAEAGRRFRMLDLGANIGVGAAQLHQFALMGAAAAASEGLGAPTVALLNIGSEVRKGPRPVRDAAALLAGDQRLRYAGYVEPDRLFRAGADVVVADGFAGNIALKAAEGALRMAGYLLERELTAAAGAETAFGASLGRVRRAYNPQLYNGARLLGLAGVVVKSHGGADREGFRCAVEQALAAASGELESTAKVGAAQRIREGWN